MFLECHLLYGLILPRLSSFPHTRHVLRESKGATATQLLNAYAPWPFIGEVRGRRQTGYESQWREEGRPMHFFAHQRLNLPAEGSAPESAHGAQASRRSSRGRG